MKKKLKEEAKKQQQQQCNMCTSLCIPKWVFLFALGLHTRIIHTHSEKPRPIYRFGVVTKLHLNCKVLQIFYYFFRERTFTQTH